MTRLTPLEPFDLLKKDQVDWEASIMPLRMIKAAERLNAALSESTKQFVGMDVTGTLLHTARVRVFKTLREWKKQEKLFLKGDVDKLDLIVLFDKQSRVLKIEASSALQQFAIGKWNGKYLSPDAPFVKSGYVIL